MIKLAIVSNVSRYTFIPAVITDAHYTNMGGRELAAGTIRFGGIHNAGLGSE
jgi:hypothetical protein